MINNEVMNAIENRFSCKKYLDKPIEKEKLDTILESGRLSPTSFGMEHFDIHVCKSKDILDACFYQESMKTAPITLVITVKKASFYNPDGSFVRERGVRFPGTVEEYIEDYRGYYEYLKEKGLLDMWAKAQGYIPLSFMMITASSLGIESCAIEGFNNDSLIKKLGLNGDEEQISICLALGYPNEKRERIRRDLDSLVKYHF